MNKKIKRIITLTLIISSFSVISAITPGTFLDVTTKTAYASSYSPNDGELKSVTVKSSNGDALDLRDGYNGSTVKLNDDKNYYAKLTDDSDGIKINATAQGSDYIVRIFTSDKTDAKGLNSGDEIPLGKGNTTLYVRIYDSLADYRKVKDQDKDVTICKEEYTINVMKTTASSYEDNTQDPIYLQNILLNTGDITFLKQRTSYDIQVDSSVSEIKITAPPEATGDRVRIDGSLVDASNSYKETVSLDNGKNEIKIKVTDDKDNQRTYTLNITRGSSSDNQDAIYLNDLTISEGTLDFSTEDTSYDVDVDEVTSKVTIGATPENEDYLVTINGKEVKSADNYENEVSLSKGKNTIDVVIKDEVNDKTKTYTLTINRGTAADNTNTGTSTDNTGTTGTSTDKKTGWVQTNAGWQYNDENGNLLKNSWVVDKGTGVYSYLNADGIRATGWAKDKDKWYLLDTKGAMLTGWQNAEGNWYYLNADGSMKTSWLLDGGKWYYINTNGTMQKGWLIQSNLKYYLNTDGTMATGTQTIDGKEYKFNTSGVLIV